MKQVFHGDDFNKVTLICSNKEVADIWFAISQQLAHLESGELQETAVYPRLKAIEDVLSGKNK
ncbi:hypothetical protein ACFSFY_02545 [Sporosarcina siberiensis]|uniref:Uncharacterized protein n=1 Tax=Sporosarcina siberiensis TaxID=1365606 RepID=A0ABW4SDE4_9BACL